MTDSTTGATFGASHIFFLGIAGIGVSALAQIAQARGITVSGADPHADPTENDAIARLLEGGARIFREHRAENLAADVDAVVTSLAVPEDAPELLAAHAREIHTYSRADMLGKLMDAHDGPKIAVAGTHGKTTTTAMIGVMLQDAGLDPTVFVGGEVAGLGGNVRIGSPGGPFVAEACEAYGSFLTLKPDIAVVTNIEADHLDYYHSFQRLQQTFKTFLTPQDGRHMDVIACAEDEGVVSVIGADGGAERDVVGYALDEPTQMPAVSLGRNIVLERRAVFEWVYAGATHAITLQVTGRHNVLNALAAATVGARLNLAAEAIARGLGKFAGAERRQELLGEVERAGGALTVIDDYAHHPTEIAATLSAIRSAYPGRRLMAIFQPHLYSRTRDFLDEFATTLSTADALIVTDIYAAREEPIPGVRSADIINRAVRMKASLPAIFLPSRDDIPGLVVALARPGDVILFLGAGNIREQGQQLVALLREQASGQTHAEGDSGSGHNDGR